MHKKIPKICTGCRVSAAKIYLCHSTEIAKARPHSEEWETDTSVQKQWSMNNHTSHTDQHHHHMQLAEFSNQCTVLGRLPCNETLHLHLHLE